MSSAFATALDQSRIPARKRVFMTATPRYFTGRVLTAAREEDLEVASMDDETIFGPVLHRLSFSQAINENLLSDYRVLVVGIDDARYRRYAERGRLVALDKGSPATDARSLASHIGVAKAMRRYDMRRVITFHGRVISAKRFARTLPAVIQWMPRAERPSGSLWTDQVSGTMSSGDRAMRLDRLQQVEAGERGILSNARCLGEGVDIPALDGIAFIDPKHSQLDIVQAVGRAIRKGQDRGIATVVIPVFVDPTADPERTLDDSAFRTIASVLRALRDHDEALAEELDALRRELGGRSRRLLRLPAKIVLDLPGRLSSDFSTAIVTRVVRLTTTSWEEGFARLQRFVATEGHARVPVACSTPDGYELGSWVRRQRAIKEQLSSDRRTSLQALRGWVWDLLEAIWEERLAQLQEFVATEGHARVPAGYETQDGNKLGNWVGTQRTIKEQLSSDRQTRLEALEGWVWDALEAGWEEGFGHLQRFVATEGHARVPFKHTTTDGHKLGGWVGSQRANKGRLSQKRRARLEELEGWVWDLREARWEEGFAQLQRYVATEGHARVPAKHRTPNGNKLGSWVNTQRTNKEQLSPDRRTYLEALNGWVWDAREARWEELFGHLQQFVATKGHARVPTRQTTRAGEELGFWVANQRKNKEQLSPEQRARLEALEGWVWHALEGRWDDSLAYLQEFVATEGHARVPASYTTRDGEKLGGGPSSKEQGKSNSHRISGNVLKL